MKFLAYNRRTIESLPSTVDPFILISIKDPLKAEINIDNSACKAILRLSFSDSHPNDKEHEPIVLMSKDDAKKIWTFFDENKDKADILIVNCEGGLCRSAAVAAAISLDQTGDDNEFFKTRLPNSYVYATLLSVRMGVES